MSTRTASGHVERTDGSPTANLDLCMRADWNAGGSLNKERGRIYAGLLPNMLPDSVYNKRKLGCDTMKPVGADPRLSNRNLPTWQLQSQKYSTLSIPKLMTPQIMNAQVIKKGSSLGSSTLHRRAREALLCQKTPERLSGTRQRKRARAFGIAATSKSAENSDPRSKHFWTEKDMPAQVVALST